MVEIAARRGLRGDAEGKQPAMASTCRFHRLIRRVQQPTVTSMASEGAVERTFSPD